MNEGDEHTIKLKFGYCMLESEIPVDDPSFPKAPVEYIGYKGMADLEKAKASNIKSQTNVQINGDLPFGQGNYGKLMEKLLKEES